MKQTVAFNYVLTVHQNLVDDHHCMAGIKDENLLHSAINGQYWYEPGIDQNYPCGLFPFALTMYFLMAINVLPFLF